jgi:hypothetical protein
MYGRFLREAAEITGEGEFEAVGQEMQAIGDQWQEVALIFKDCGQPGGESTRLPEAAGLLDSYLDAQRKVAEGRARAAEAVAS